MRNTIYTLVLTLVLIGVIKLVLPEPKENKELVEQFWVNKTFADSNYDVVVAGDSRVYRGVSIDHLTKGAGGELNGINIGYSSAGFSDEYLDFAVSKLNPESKNKTLLIGLTPHSLTLEAFKNEDLKEHLEVGAFDQFRYRNLSPFLGHFSPYNPLDLVKRNDVNYQQEYNEDGWVASHYLRPDSSYALKSYTKVFSEYQVSDTAVTSFLSKIGEISSSGIEVLVFRPPTTVAMRNLEDSLSGYNEAYVVRELEKMSIKHLGFDDSAFTSYDGSHLHQDAARKLSFALGKQISEIN
ncbi:MAG: hypothetical protein ACPGED_06905 [Flavobacteriales bacterium]